jgi:protocatechuate 3,4-dioxygenase beta subunit
MRAPLFVAAIGVAGLGVSLSALPQITTPPTAPARPAAAAPSPPLVANSVIVGRVIDSETGKGISGAIVTLNGGPTRAPNPPAVPGTPVSPPPPPPPPLALSVRIMTDSEGRFAYRGLTRGNYSLTAAKAGYAAGGFGALRLGVGSRVLQLDDGEKVADATIRLFKYASISGTVLDEAGEPIVSTIVRSYRRVLMSGRRVFAQGNQVQTDDRGTYRIGNLLPGEYVIVVPIVPVTIPAANVNAANRQNFSQSMQGLSMGAGPMPGIGGQAVGPDPRFFLQRNSGISGEVAALPNSSGRVLGFATAYYPGARTIAEAEPIRLAAGEDRAGVDLTMRRVPTAAISGQIFGSGGPASDYVVRLVPSESGESFAEPEVAVGMSDAGGNFMFLAVPAGLYSVQAFRIPRPAPPSETVRVMPAGAPPAPTPVMNNLNALSPTMEPLLWAAAPVAVADADVRGVALTLREGLTISGRLEFSGGRPRPDAQRLSQIPIMIEKADGQSSQFAQGPPSRVGPDGRFLSTGQLPGRYFVRVGGPPSGWYVHSVTANGVDAMDVPVELSTTSLSNVVVTFTDQMSDLRGRVDAPPGGDPVAVVVFPADSSGWKNYGVNPIRMRMARPSANGSFAIGPLPPGDYLVTAIPDLYSAEWQDPAYLEQLARMATRFTLGVGERRTQDVTVQNIKPPGTGRPPAPPPVDSNVATSFEDEDRPRGPAALDEGTGGSPEPGAFQVRDSRAATPANTLGSISGVVRVSDGSGAPARFARVIVRSANVPGERISITDDEGRYAVMGLSAGVYQVSVTKPAYLTMFFGARRPLTAAGTPVRVDAGQTVKGIDITLVRGGVLTGMVTDPDGEPASNVRIQLLQRTMIDGEPRLQAAPSTGNSMTDDRGMFRLFGLRPGSYAVAATIQGVTGPGNEVRQLSDQEIRDAVSEAAKAARPPGLDGTPRVIPPAPPGATAVLPPAGRPVGFSPVYYPGTPIEEQAGLLTISPGQETRIALSMQLVPTARVEGTVSLPDGQPAPIGGTSISLQYSSATGSASASARIGQNGRFEAQGLAPGRYSITARLTQQDRGPNPAPGTPVTFVQLFAQQEVDVNGVDVSGIALTLAPPLTVTGRVIFEGGTPPADAVVQVRLDAAGRNPTAAFARQLKTADNGEFAISNVTPGRYRVSGSVSVQAPPGTPTLTAPWSVKSATIDGRDAFETAFDIAAGRPPGAIVVTMTSRLPQLSATITDEANKPIPNMMFVLFSASREHWIGSNARRVRLVSRPTDEGVFQFGSMLPGEYYLAVVTEIEPTDLSDPSYLDQLVPAAIKLTLADGDRKVQNLRIKAG